MADKLDNLIPFEKGESGNQMAGQKEARTEAQ
jgi:hypothetical protein